MNDDRETEKQAPYYYIQSVDRTLQILRCFIREQHPLGVSEVAQMLKLNRSAVHRFMLNLQDHGYLRQMKDSDKYGIGPTAFELGAVYTNSTDLTVEGKKVLIELVGRTGLTTHLAVLDKDAVLYLVHVEPDHRQYLFGAVGQRGAIYHTALGKSLTAWLPREKVAALLANCSFEKKTERTIDSLERFLEELERVRKVGYAVDDEESSFGAHCFSAPVRSRSGEVIAAISATGLGLSDIKKRELGLIVKNSAAQLSRRIGSYEWL